MSLLLLFKQSINRDGPPFYKKISAKSLCLFKCIKQVTNPKSEIFCFLAYRFLICSKSNKNAFCSLKCVSLGISLRIIAVILAADSYVAIVWSSNAKKERNCVRIDPFWELIFWITSLKTSLSSMRMASIVGNTNSIKSRSELRHLTMSNNASMMSSESSWRYAFWTALFSWLNFKKFYIDFGFSNFSCFWKLWKPIFTRPVTSDRVFSFK